MSADRDSLVMQDQETGVGGGRGERAERQRPVLLPHILFLFRMYHSRSDLILLYRKPLALLHRKRILPFCYFSGSQNQTKRSALKPWPGRRNQTEHLPPLSTSLLLRPDTEDPLV